MIRLQISQYCLKLKCRPVEKKNRCGLRFLQLMYVTVLQASLYDKGDEGWFSCAERIDAKDPGIRFKEVELLMGKGQKGFRIAKSKFMSQWQTPLFDWIK